MGHERLAQMIQTHLEALRAHPEAHTPHESILSILRGLDSGEITVGQAQRLLGYQALRLDDTPAYAALYRQAAADIRAMQRQEHERALAANVGSQGNV